MIVKIVTNEVVRVHKNRYRTAQENVPQLQGHEKSKDGCKKHSGYEVGSRHHFEVAGNQLFKELEDPQPLFSKVTTATLKFARTQVRALSKRF